MSLNIRNTEIRLQHYMDAEGSEDKQMTVMVIEKHLYDLGYYIYNVDIVFDHLQNVWRWNCDIIKI
jgi:hypothetical protein